MEFKSQVGLADIIDHINEQLGNQTWIKIYPLYIIGLQPRNYTHFFSSTNPIRTLLNTLKTHRSDLLLTTLKIVIQKQTSSTIAKNTDKQCDKLYEK